VTPCRVVDTRLPDGPFGGPPIQGQGSRSFAIPNGSCGIPNTALAYSLNVTVVPHGFLDYLTVWPTGQQQPFVPTLNSYDGRVKANAAIVAAGVGEAISVFAANTTDVVLDIDGYFVSAIDLSTLDFFPLTPCRVVDTRGAPGDLGGPSLMGGVPRTFPILEATPCNIPEHRASLFAELHRGAVWAAELFDGVANRTKPTFRFYSERSDGDGDGQRGDCARRGGRRSHHVCL
jgi:hypothetical protein